jgi:hypothetical protein
LNDPIFTEYKDKFIEFLKDSNVVALEKAIKTIEKWLIRVEEVDLDVAEITKLILEKCLTTGKANIKIVSLEILCLLIEKSNKDQVFNTIICNMTHKNPKVMICY